MVYQYMWSTTFRINHIQQEYRLYLSNLKPYVNFLLNIWLLIILDKAWILPKLTCNYYLVVLSMPTSHLLIITAVISIGVQNQVGITKIIRLIFINDLLYTKCYSSVLHVKLYFIWYYNAGTILSPFTCQKSWDMV